MARKTKKRPRGRGTGAASPGSKEDARRERRERALLQREEVRRRARRHALVRRAVVWGTAGILVALAVGYYVLSSQARNRLVADAARVAGAAGCSPVETKPDRGRAHSPPFTYDQRPATSGPHASPLRSDVRVYDAPVPEENAVHNLEHGYVLIYYRAEGDRSLPPAVVQALEALAEEEDKVIVAPYLELEDGTALALAAWNRLQQCPSAVTSAQATTLAEAFIDQFRGGGEAPEANAP